MKYAMLVLKNLMRSKRRTVLTIVSIAVSLFIFSALISLPTVANELLADTASSVRIAVHNKAGLTYALPEAYKTRIDDDAACGGGGAGKLVRRDLSRGLRRLP